MEFPTWFKHHFHHPGVLTFFKDNHLHFYNQNDWHSIIIHIVGNIWLIKRSRFSKNKDPEHVLLIYEHTVCIFDGPLLENPQPSFAHWYRDTFHHGMSVVGSKGRWLISGSNWITRLEYVSGVWIARHESMHTGNKVLRIYSREDEPVCYRKF